MSLPVRITVFTPAGEEAFGETEVTHLLMEGKILRIYDGASLVKEYKEGEWLDWKQEDIEPDIMDYTGPDFPV